ncbi:MAG: DNA repair protein RadC [Eubacteriaceae bacterium]|nr:DNA repair protein RadC [Eubacteriaceae bacterium]
MNKITDKNIIANITTEMNLRGASSLSDEQLLALILREGTPSRDVMEVSKGILARFSLSDLATLPKKHLISRVKGLTEESVTSLEACLEINNRINREKTSGKILRNAADIYDLVRNEMIHYKKEYFRAISVNCRLELIGTEDVSIGSVDSASAHPREVFRSAIALGAYGIFLVHNHPSDSPQPSLSDILATEKIKQSGNIIGIQLIDHVIVTSGGYYSFNSGKTVLQTQQSKKNNKCSQNAKNVL